MFEISDNKQEHYTPSLDNITATATSPLPIVDNSEDIAEQFNIQLVRNREAAKRFP
jgi:hypothetical protein